MLKDKDIPEIVTEHPYYRAYLDSACRKHSSYKDLSSRKLEAGSLVFWDTIFAEGYDKESGFSPVSDETKFERVAFFGEQASASSTSLFRVVIYRRLEGN